MAIHVAESAVESQLVVEGRGAFAEGLRGRGIVGWRRRQHEVTDVFAATLEPDRVAGARRIEGPLQVIAGPDADYTGRRAHHEQAAEHRHQREPQGEPHAAPSSKVGPR